MNSSTRIGVVFSHHRSAESQGSSPTRCFRRQDRQRGHGQNRGRRRDLRGQQLPHLPRNETSIDTTGDEIRMRDDAPEQIKIAGDPRDGAIVQRLPQPAQRRPPRLAVTISFASMAS